MYQLRTCVIDVMSSQQSSEVCHWQRKVHGQTVKISFRQKLYQQWQQTLSVSSRSGSSSNSFSTGSSSSLTKVAETASVSAAAAAAAVAALATSAASQQEQHQQHQQLLSKSSTNSISSAIIISSLGQAVCHVCTARAASSEQSIPASQQQAAFANTIQSTGQPQAKSVFQANQGSM